jgi:hypothetical protein
MAPRSEITIIDEALTDEVKAVLRVCAKESKVSEVHVRPLGRYGYSGAQLFQVRLGILGGGVPFVVKIDTAEKINREVEALRGANSYFFDAEFKHIEVHGQTLQGIKYQLKTADKEQFQIVEFEEVYKDKARPDNEVCDVLGKVYESCRFAHQYAQLISVPLRSHYEWYLRKDRPDRISETYGNTGIVRLFGKNYPSPRAVINRLLQRSLPTPCVRVHGDLHPNNVVLASGGPALIDFAWFKSEMDLYVDYVLMECSL